MNTPLSDNEPLLEKEAVNLEDVYPYQNLDSSADVAFSDLTQLAACVCQTPIALLCLINTKRRWIQSQIGITGDACDDYLALCTEILQQPETWEGKLLLVQDTLADQNFASYNLVKSEQKVRFYAGVPLVTPQGLILGILSTIDCVPRSLTLEQQQALTALGRQAIAQLEWRKNSTYLKVIVNNPPLAEKVSREGHATFTNKSNISLSESLMLATPEEQAVATLEVTAISLSQPNATSLKRSHSSTLEVEGVREELLSRREALLFRLAGQIRNSLDLNTILDTAVTEIRNLLDVDCCHFLWCWSESHQPSLSVTHEACNPHLPSLLGESPPPYIARLAENVRNLETLRIDNLNEASNIDPEMRSLLQLSGMTSGLLLPLKTKTGQLGAIVCSHYKGTRPWSNQEVELLHAVVDQLAIAIEHAELFAKTRAAALAAQTQARQLQLALQDLQQTESRLIQTEKMSSLGQMIAGIAHEINNPVSFITGNLSHANNYIQDLLFLIERYQQNYPDPVPQVQDCIEEIEFDFILEDLPKILTSMQMGADRIHEIVLSLRKFSRADDAHMKPVSIHEGIDNTLLILHNRLKPSGNNSGIMIVKEYGDLPLVECYAGQINQVFMNIIGNAIDALENHPEPKNITICTSTSTEEWELEPWEEESCFHAHPLASIPSVIIRIRDNGPGMTQNIAQHLFDPFFTTKPVGKGTGLGLSISYQIIVEKHSGILKCISQPGQGAEFWIQIPIVQVFNSAEC